MDFNQAIRAHAAWKMKLSVYLAKPDGSLKVADIEPDNRCALGQWIYAEGQKLAQFPEFTALRNEHTRFHTCAASIVKKADSGQNMTEETALGADSEFSRSSAAVIAAIMTMKRKTEPAPSLATASSPRR